MSSKISIVILNWNGRKHLEQFLPSVIANHHADQQIVVVDNASTDQSIDFLREHAEITVVLLEKNLGFSGGYNESLKSITSEYYVLLNSDVQVTPNWIDPIVALMDSDPTIAACQPKILSYNDKTKFEYAGAAGGWIDSWGYPFARGRVFEFCEQDLSQYDNIEGIFWASGAALFVRADAFHFVGGFDNYFFAHMEEIDLCWRLQLAGYRILACPKSIVYHVGGASLPKDSPRKTFLNFRNNLIMIVKNLPAPDAAYRVMGRLVLDFISALRFLLSGKFAISWAVVNGDAAFFNWLFFKKKHSVFPVSRHKNLEGMFRGCIAWKYFVLGKKTFAQIVKNKT